MKQDLYQRVTDQIVASLEKGVKPWHKPWSATATPGAVVMPRRSNGKPYRGINILMLWGAAADNGYSSPSWFTFKQALELGACVRKGERGTQVVYSSTFNRTEMNEATGEDQDRTIPFLKAYTAFNAEQIEGLPEQFRTPAPVIPTGPQRIERAEAFATSTGAIIRHGGNRAFYSPGADIVQMPPLQAFKDAESYYATLAHELTHWTGHKTRLAREFGKRFADKAYAFEELIAELGSAFLFADLALSPEPRADHADYLGHWLDVLKADKRAIFTAASQAQRAADFLTGERAALQEAA